MDFPVWDALPTSSCCQSCHNADGDCGRCEDRGECCCPHDIQCPSCQVEAALDNF